MKPNHNKKTDNIRNYILVILALFSIIGLFALYYGRNKSEMPRLSLQSGLYEGPVTLEIEAGAGAKIYYSIDGSEPTRDSILYTGPITLTDATEQENRISARSDLSVRNYEIPSEKIDKANIIKARAFYFLTDEGSDVAVGNYLVKPKDELDSYLATDVLFLSADTNDLLDYENGMMVRGVYFDGFLSEKEISSEDFKDLDYDDNEVKANYSRQVAERFEKQVDLEYVRNNEVIMSDIYTIRNRGVSSSNGPKKTYNLYFREKCSREQFNKELFLCGESQDKLILRREDCLLKDALYERLFRGTEMILPDGGVPVQVFVNGEYWGLYCLEEKMDKNWFSTHLGISGDRITVLKNNSVSFGNEKADDELEALMEFCDSNDLRIPENYDYFCERVDIDSFMMYYAAMFYLEACDFTETYNTMQWRIEGDKWHWALYDLDNSAHNASHDTLNNALKAKKNNAIGKHIMFGAVMRNNDAQEVFREKVEDLKSILSVEKVSAILDAERDAISLAGENDNRRWSFSVDWDDEIDKEEQFFGERCKNVDEFVDLYCEKRSR